MSFVAGTTSRASAVKHSCTVARTQRNYNAMPWLPEGKHAAVCFSIDDIHPGRSTDAFEAGGDLEHGALGFLQTLLQRHAQLHCTLFTTADWRQIRPTVHRALLSRVPRLRNAFFLTRPLPRGTMRLDRHPAFVRFLQSFPRTDVALHGLHHLRRGPNPLIEFDGCSQAECEQLISTSIEIFRTAGLDFSPGLCPPVWHFSSALGEAMLSHNLRWVASARDLNTPVTDNALSAGSGLRGVALFRPQRISGSRLLHFPTNFQATSSIDRALAILDAGGLLSIKAHISKHLPGHTLLDGLDSLYCNYLDTLFREIDRRYGTALWWTSMDAIATHINRASPAPVRTSVRLPAIAELHPIPL